MRRDPIHLMEDKLIRSANLRALAARRGLGPTALAREMGRSSSFWSDRLRERNTIGEDLAREIESHFGLARYALDEPIDQSGVPLPPSISKNWRNRVAEMDLEGNDDFPSIPKVRFKISGGITGFGVEYIDDGADPIVFRRDWFESRGYKPGKLFAIAVMNGSMEPTLYAGDLVVVNTEDTSLKDGAVVAVNFEGETVVKRLQRDEGQWWLASDNPDKRRYPRKVCTPEVSIIGRIVHKQSETI